MITDPATIAEALGIQHHFSSGVYAKQVTLPRGTVAEQHVHTFDHLSILARGRVQVSVDGVTTEYSAHAAPVCLTIKAGSAHTITALEDSAWFCIHASEETDPTRIDDAILHKGH